MILGVPAQAVERSVEYHDSQPITSLGLIACRPVITRHITRLEAPFPILLSLLQVEAYIFLSTWKVTAFRGYRSLGASARYSPANFPVEFRLIGFLFGQSATFNFPIRLSVSLVRQNLTAPLPRISPAARLSPTKATSTLSQHLFLHQRVHSDGHNLCPFVPSADHTGTGGDSSSKRRKEKSRRLTHIMPFALSCAFQ